MTEVPRGFVIDCALAMCEALAAADVTCEVGGALALAYHVDEPRATRNVDVNVGVPPQEAAHALAMLPHELPRSGPDLARARRDGQVRLTWPAEGVPPVPVHLFFAAHEIHEVAHQRAVTVPLRDRKIRVVSATDLTVFKALSDRPADWADICAMLDAHDTSVDLAEAAHWVGQIVGADDHRAKRLLDL